MATVQTLIGQRLMDQYLILKPLEAGGFSQTYLALDTEQPEVTGYLVKLLDHSHNRDFSTLKHCFDNEALALGHMQYAEQGCAVPKLIAYCRDRDQLYIVQEYIEGQRLDHWMASQQQLRLREILNLLKELLTALAQIHDQNIIHCDIKPSNLIRRSVDGKLFLIDFGACRFVDKPSPELTLGTPGYMPQEQTLGKPQFNSDLYALGRMMIQILTGISPQELDESDQMITWQTHIPHPLLHLPLFTFIDRLVQPHPEERYPTAQAALVDLQMIMANNYQSLRSWTSKPFTRIKQTLASR